MSFNIVIPSHKRAERVYSKDLVTDPIICVAKSQYDEYKYYNPECEIVCHPDNIIGLVPKRNWMVNHFGELFMIDDDVTGFQPVYRPLGESSARITDKEYIRNCIERLWRIACLIDVNLFGFNSVPNPINYRPFKPYSLKKGITGCAYGVRKSPNTLWPENLKVKEDFWINGYIKYTERKILVDNRYNFNQKDTFVNSGGLASIRNKDVEEQSILFIKKSFGDVVKLKSETGKHNQSQENNITMKFPF